jgi:hypothetical protein
MAPQVGDLVQILSDTHGYPDNWIRGTDPLRFPTGTTGILLDIIQPSYSEPRTFYKVATPLGSVSIFEGFTLVIR